MKNFGFFDNNPCRTKITQFHILWFIFLLTYN